MTHQNHPQNLDTATGSPGTSQRSWSSVHQEARVTPILEQAHGTPLQCHLLGGLSL